MIRSATASTIVLSIAVESDGAAAGGDTFALHASRICSHDRFITAPARVDQRAVVRLGPGRGPPRTR